MSLNNINQEQEEDSPITEIIFYIRSFLGMSQEKFANLIGCSRQRIARAENSEDHSVDQEIICKIYILVDTIVNNESSFNLKEFQKTILSQLKIMIAKHICCSDAEYILKSF